MTEWTLENPVQYREHLCLHSRTGTSPKILGRNLDKSLKSFHSHLYSIALRFLFLQTPGTSYSFYSSVKEKGRKPYRKPYPLPYGIRNPYRSLKSENSQEYYQRLQRNCTFMNSASVEHATAPPHSLYTLYNVQCTCKM